MLVLISAVIFGLPSDPILDQAGFFLSNGFYDQAITEYKRFIFFNPGEACLCNVHRSISTAYCRLKDWDNAISAMRLAVQSAPDDSARSEMQIALAVTLIAAGRYSMAEMVLLQLGMSGLSADVKSRASFLRGIACTYAFKWAEARAAFGEYFRIDSAPVLQAKIDSLLLAGENHRLKSPGTARWLSTFIPGAGQVYAGDLGNGVNSFLLNGALGAWIIYKLWHGYWADAYLIYSFLEGRYYTGNRYHARRLAEEANATFNRKTAGEIIEDIGSE